MYRLPDVISVTQGQIRRPADLFTPLLKENPGSVGTEKKECMQKK